MEAALEVARAGLAQEPSVPLPPGLRPYLDFARLSPAALQAIARVVDRDDEFRARVAAAVDEASVGRAGWLWLHRPEGWQDELDDIEAGFAAEQAERQRERDERRATKKLRAAQAAAREAEALAEARRRDVEALRAQLEQERAAQADARRHLGEAEEEIARLEAARAEAVRNLKDVEQRLVERSTQLNAAKARVRTLEEQVRAVAEPRDATPARSQEGGWPALGAPQELLAREIGRAAAAAASLADALAGLASLLGPAAGHTPGDRGGQGDDGARPSPVPGAPPGAGAGAAVAAADRGAAAPVEAGGVPAEGVRGGTPRRRPLALPGGIFDDSVDAVAHLLRARDAVLVVDGYNVSMTGWPGLPVAEQRRRLVVLLAEAAARSATEVEVVFDGADIGEVAVPAPGRSMVRVRFSSPGVEADDVVLDLVAQLPAARPVVVASSDRRVREAARRLGANLVHARQLLDGLRR